jgi:hypothetical protein
MYEKTGAKPGIAARTMNNERGCEKKRMGENKRSAKRGT